MEVISEIDWLYRALTFYEPVNHRIRFHFAKKDETLLAALDRLQNIRRKLPKR